MRRDCLRALGWLLTGFPPELELNWSGEMGREIIEQARCHGVSALLFWRLQQQGQPKDPESTAAAAVKEELSRDFYAAIAHSMIAERQLAEVLDALAAAEVPAMVIKGAALAAFYPDPALRLYGDLDLLVPRAQLDQAEGVLQNLGFRSAYSKAWSLEYGYDVPMINDDGQSTVELHWRLDYPEGVGHLPDKDLWERAVPWSVGGQPALRLETVDMVLYLCSHAAVKHHARLGLRPLCDLAQATAGWREADWDTLAQRAVGCGLTRPVTLMLVLAEQVLGLTVPPEVIVALEPSGSAPLPPDLVDALLQPDSLTGKGRTVGVPAAMMHAEAEGTLLGRVRHILWHLFLPPNGMAVVYNIPANSPRIWLTYLWRPVDLLRRYGRFVWGLLSGERTAQRTWAREVRLERWLRAGPEARDDR